MKLFSKNKDTKNNAKLEGVPATKKKRGKKKWIILGVIVVVLILLAFVVKSCGRQQIGVKASYTYAQAERRDITSTLTGSGALESADSYTVISLVSGEILSAEFEEGDIVSKDDVLYKVDSSDAATSIERAENSLSKSQRAYNKKIESMTDLTVSAPIDGRITGISVEVGDNMNANAAVATIENTSVLTLTEYYSSEYSGQIHSGMPATVSIANQMLTLSGSVKEVSSLTRTSETGVSCFAVTVQVTNPGALNVGDTATCWLGEENSEIYPSITDDDGLDASARTTVYCSISGTVADVCVRNNETVSTGQTIIKLTSDTLSDDILNSADSLRDAELSLQSQYDILENYTITAPISGTIVDKYYKQGENAETGKTLCTIFDLSSLNITLNVDELDISNVSVGQTATITADAVSGVTYEGKVTKVGINGTSANGVTTYPVTIRIDETDRLLPGMNADVSIVVSENAGVIAVPADAVQTGGRILVKKSDGSTGFGAPEGYDYVRVETGVADKDYVEIISGLSEGDEIAWLPKSASGISTFPMGGGFVPGMGGAGIGGGPSGGPSSRPSSRPSGGPSGGSRGRSPMGG